jgi:hypothetical protein
LKKIKKRIKENIVFNTSPAIKMSELIAKYASEYINMGETTEERQSYLNGACTAWNIANLPDHLREKALHQAAEEYQKLNPEIDDVDNYLHDMKILIQKKLQMFPEIKKAIVDAFIETINDTQYRINVVSTDNPRQLFKC